MTQINRIAALVLLAGCTHIHAGDVATGGTAGPMGDLRAMYPGAHVHMDDGRVRIVYGVPMTPGATPQEAAEGWLTMHGSVFGAGRLELEELWATPVMGGRFTAFGYRQYIDGLPVEYGNIRVLVLNEPLPRVVYAAATAAPTFPTDQVPINLDADLAQQIVSAMPLFRSLDHWGEAELAVYQGDGAWIDPVLTWKFVGEDGAAVAARDGLPGAEGVGQSKTFFVDVTTGRLVHVRNEIYSNEVTGTVKGWATSGVWPDSPTNPPTLQEVGEMRVRLSSGQSTFGMRDGSYVIQNAGTTQVNAETGVGTAQGFGGLWVNVTPNTGTPIQQSLPVTPPGEANFVLNPTPSEHLTAQVNAFIGTSLARNYFADLAPGFTALDVPLRAVTSSSGSCNAFFQAGGPNITFLSAGGSCPNTAYSTIIAHEYGHFIVNRLGLGQGGFGEGYSDVTAMMIYDDGVVARGFSGPGTLLRDPVAANVQYPCSGGVHHCGQLLGGSWWRIRTNLEAVHGTAQALEMARERQVAWSLISTGGTGSNFVNAAHPETAIQVLTVDDDDGNLANGTPNWFQICAAFSAHSIPCPALTFLDFELPSGVPSFVTADQPFEVPVNVIPVASTAKAGTGKLVYRLQGGSYTTVPMQELGPDSYLATLPALECGEYVEYYFSAETSGGLAITHPAGAPNQVFGSTAGVAVEVPLLETTFPNTWPAGWWATGLWHVNSSCAPVGNIVPGCGEGPHAYYGRSGTCNYNLPTGAHKGELNAPELQIPDVGPNGEVRLTFCYALKTEDSLHSDKAELFVNGQTRPEWRLPDVIPTPGDPDLHWAQAEFDLTEFSGQAIEVSWRFDTVNSLSNAHRGWHVNNVRFLTTVAGCDEPCYANCNRNTTEPILSVDDFTCFINEFALAQGLAHEQQVEHYANCDGSTTVPVLTVDDFTCFINAFAQGCP